MRFTSYLTYTILIYSKLVPESFKIFILYNTSYIFTFVFNSLVASTKDNIPLE